MFGFCGILICFMIVLGLVIWVVVLIDCFVLMYFKIVLVFV